MRHMQETDKGYAEWLELDRRVRTQNGFQYALIGVLCLLAVGLCLAGAQDARLEGRIEKLESAAKAAARPTYPACTATIFEREPYHRTEARRVVVNHDAEVEFTSNEASTIITLDGDKIDVKRINR